MQPTSTQILQAVRETIRDRLSPAMSGAPESALLAPLDVALTELMAREARNPKPREEALVALVARGHALLNDQGNASPASAALLTSMVVDAQRMLGRGLDGSRRQSISQWISDVVHWQYDDGLPVKGKDCVGQPPAPEIDHAILANAISHHLAADAPCTIDSFSILSGGYSRDTFLVCWSAGAASGQLVLRRQKPEGMLDGAGVGLDGEFPLLEFAHAIGLPVPAVLWLEHSIEAGGPYIVMEKAKGEVIGTAIDASGVSDEAIREVAICVARLHQAEWRSANTDIAGLFGLSEKTLTTTTATKALLDRWEESWIKRALDPSPALAVAFQWLRQNIPVEDAEPRLLHGDIGFHNILFDKGRISALLDWEMANLGDPAKDMATCEAFISRYGRWDYFVRCYHDAGGAPFTEEAKQYYHVLRIFTHLLVGEMGWQTCFAHLAAPKIEAMYLGGPIRMHFFADYLNYLPLISGKTEIGSTKSC